MCKRRDVQACGQTYRLRHPEVTGTDIKTGAEVRMIVAETIREHSWLREPEYAWFVDGHSYAAHQTRAISALAHTLPEELFFAVSAIIRGGTRGEHKEQMLDKLGLKMEYQVTFRFGFSVDNKQYEATVTEMLSFVPFENMHVGSSQFLTVCQVYWLGGNKFRADIADVNYRSYPPVISLERVVASLKSAVCENWKFEVITGEQRTPIDL